MARMGQYIPLRVPLPILWGLAERFDLGKVVNPFSCLEEMQTERRFATFFRPLEPFLANSFHRQLGVAVLNALGKGDGFGMRVQFESPGKLHSPQDPKRIFGKRSAGMAQRSVFDVLEPSVKIKNPGSLWVVHQ